jgi:hypothetical protein
LSSFSENVPLDENDLLITTGPPVELGSMKMKMKEEKVYIKTDMKAR